ncbi:(2Fe-2S)-binding protein [Caballeronia sordidicola]|uniref:(2Fe-2S)-binding protein n=1 Tax=Caballeronia sordidicola TaxID=196367 RepID=UPI000B7922B5|nr:(2Fe-2S)-binding protein [Caballeronia sordidicola]
MAELTTIRLNVNGHTVIRDVEPRTHLIDFLRDSLQIKGARVGCEHGVCGACTVRLNDKMVRGCLVLAVQTDNSRVETIEGASDRGDLAELQAAFHARNALQCGFCTTGMLFTAAELIALQPDATRDEIRKFMSGNYCRCTGYQAIVDAIADVLAARAKQHASEHRAC